MEPHKIHEPTIAIVMATYNGSAFISEQIRSIQNQTRQNWKLYIRDDGSKDDTVTIASKFAESDGRITIVSDRKGNLGFTLNFFELLSLTSENYVAFADQDDYWYNDKLEKLYRAITAIEGDPSTPALAHCDSSVTDANLKITETRFIGPRGNVSGLDGIIFGNCVQGACSMINRPLLEIAIKLKPTLPFDFHIACIAAICGTRAYVDEPLALYRQHSANALGAVQSKKKFKKVHWIYTESLLGALITYSHFKNAFSELIANNPNKAVDDYLYIFEGKNPMKKLWIYAMHRYPLSRKKDKILLFLMLAFNVSLINAARHCFRRK